MGEYGFDLFFLTENKKFGGDSLCQETNLFNGGHHKDRASVLCYFSNTHCRHNLEVVHVSSYAEDIATYMWRE
jgi:hypothetical protein